MSHSIRIQAEVVFANEHQLFSPGQVVCRYGRIVEVTSRCDTSPDINLPDIVLLPALVNPHTHLEFSELSAPLAAGASFPEWVASVLAYRRGRFQGVDAAHAVQQSIDLGMTESFASGVGVVTDIVTPPWHPQMIASKVAERFFHIPCAPHVRWDALQPLIREHFGWLAQCPSLIACVEQLGLNDERIADYHDWADSIWNCALSRIPQELYDVAISPHAPYSIRSDFLQSTIALATATQSLMAMHIAESPAEREWLDHHRGPFQEMLLRLGFADSHYPPRLGELFACLARVPRALLIHGNYLNTPEIEELSKYRERISVVYCPRTHHHFQHSCYPLEPLREHGIRVVIGTDSRSSNPDLNLWKDAAFAVQHNPSLSATDAFAAITNSAALALGIEGDFGAIQAGRKASFAIAPLGAIGRADLESGRECILEKLLLADASPTSLFTSTEIQP